MANYALMGNDISNAAGNGPPNFPFGLTQPTTPSNPVKDLANGATYTITNSDAFSYFTSSVALSGSNKGFILPLAANNIGRTLIFKRTDTAGNENTGGNGIWFTITCQASDMIDGLYASTPLIAQNSYIGLIAEAPNMWRVVGCQDWIQIKVGQTTGPANATFTDVTTCSVPTGTWDLGSNYYLFTPTVNASIMAIYIATVAGNTATGRIMADNYAGSYCGNTNAGDCSATITNFRQVLTTTTTYYSKIYAAFSSGTPSYAIKFTARRFS